MALDLSGGASERLPGSRVLVWVRPDTLPVAGLELWRRAVYTASRAGFERVLVVAEGGADTVRTALAGDHRLEATSWDVLASADDWAEHVARARGRWVAFCDQWVVDGRYLRELATTSGPPASARAEGPLALEATDLAALAASGWNPTRPPPHVGQLLEPPPLYACVASPQDVAAAEEALFRSLARNATNVLARYVDRAMSRAISRRLAPFPITPNQITIFSIALGVVGGLCLLRPTYGFGLLGSFLFLASTVIDGCDGEIARLKFQESRQGAQLDVVGDNIVHAVLFPCVALHAYFAGPSGPYLKLGAVALAGVIVTWIAVYAVIVRGKPSQRALELFELFGNREFAYLLFLLALFAKLHWFVWGMAIGLWVFPAALIALGASEKRKS